jgi:acetyl esterase
VARVPRLPPAVEHRFLRFVCGLPPRLQRLLFGAPPVVEGQRLADDVHALLWIAESFRGDSLREKGSPAEARRERLAEARIVAHRPQIPMARVERHEIPGPAGRIAARLYVPPQSAGDPPPLLVYFHGGGWVIGDLDTHDDPCRFLAAASGAALLAIDYRLAPEHPFPAAADDAHAAAKWAATEYGGPIAVAGDSAGGNLAAVTALRAREQGPEIALQVLVYPVVDSDLTTDHYAQYQDTHLILNTPDMVWFWGHYAPDPADRVHPDAAPLRAESHEGLPPAWVLLAGNDPLLAEGEAYVARLEEAGVPVTAVRYDDQIHAFFTLPNLIEAGNRALAEAGAAINAAL